jgi:flagellar FliL protein
VAEEELEVEGAKKSPILKYILIGVGAVLTLVITVLATMFFLGGGTICRSNWRGGEDC